jgi:hypothetical protein
VRQEKGVNVFQELRRVAWYVPYASLCQGYVARVPGFEVPELGRRDLPGRGGGASGAIKVNQARAS